MTTQPQAPRMSNAGALFLRLRQRFIPGQIPRIAQEELQAVGETLQKMKAEGQTNDPDFHRLIQLMNHYQTLRKGLLQQQHQQQTSTAQPSASQLAQLKRQIQQTQSTARQIDLGLNRVDSIDAYQHLHNQPFYSLHKIIVPSAMPQGLDPIQMQQERDKRVRTRVLSRINELEHAPMDDLKSVIELKSLRLLERQKQLRLELQQSMRRQSTLQTAASRSDYRRLKKPSLREIRFTEKMEIKHRQEREKKEKQKHIDYLNHLLSHGRDMLNYQKQLEQKQLKLGRAIVQWHNNLEKEEQKKQERLTKERIKALKADDEEAYLKLIDKQKDTRIAHLLKQTDSYLDQLSSLVQEQQHDIRLREGQASVPVGVLPADVEDKTDYFNIAHRIKEEIKEQPSILTGGTLKEYQIKGLEWLVSLYNNKLNGILADEMGLGKTIQTISLITFLMEKKNQCGPFLIIVPLSTITNWALEFEKWAPSVVKVVYKGSPNQRRDIQMAEMRHNNFNVLLTTYEYIIKDKAVLSKIKWIHTIIDEGHRMKNASSKLSVTLSQFYSTRYRVILTGTPLQNNLPELWALLNFVLPRVFNSVKSFDEWFNTPFANTGEKIELNEEEQLLVIKRLHKVLRPFLLRRLKKDVEADLPDKVERVLKTPLSALQQKLYAQIRKSSALMIGQQEQGKKAFKSINNTIMQLKKVCNHPFVFREVEEDIGCLGVTDQRIVRVSGKFELLDRILPKFKVTGHRVLIFFQMTHIMDIMEDFLRWRGFNYLRLDGSTKTEERSEMLKLFNAPDSEYFVFILSTRAGGLGLNLQSADTVIIYDSDWNPHQDLQAQDRAHRIGQTKEVRIFRLISANSIEENILARAQYKLDIDGKVIQAGRFDNKSTNEERDNLLRSLLGNNPEDVEGQDVDDDDDLNEIIARSEEEMEIYKRIDNERNEEFNRWWRENGMKGEPSRLIREDELPEIYLTEVVEQFKEDEDKEYGRGQRSKKEVTYDDGLSEEQWTKAVDQEMDLDEVIEKKRRKRKLQQEQVSGSEFEKKRRIEDDDEADEDGEEGDKRIKSDLVIKMKRALERVKQSKEEYEDGSVRLRCELFRQLPSKKDYPDYFKMIREPIALDIIERRMEEGYYRTLDMFKRDLKLMFNNARKYNVEGSIVFDDANEMEREFNEEFTANY